MPIAPAFQRHLDACFQQAPVWFESIVRQVRETARQTRDPHVRAATPATVAELSDVLERRHAELAQRFLEALKERVMESVDPPKPAARRGGPDFAISIGELHLVDEDQAAEEIEVIRVVQMADDAAEWELRELQARCATLRGESSVRRDSNPWRPDTVARAIWDAGHAVGLSSPARTLLMRLCAGPLARELREACIRLVKQLDEMKVEPAAYRALPVGGAERRSAEPHRAEFDVTQPGKFEELMRVAVPGAAGGGGAGQVPMSNESLERLEALLQRVLAAVPPAAVRAGLSAQAQQAGEPSAAPVVPNLIRQHQAQLQSAARHDSDRHVISMLAQLFDKILADAQLTAPLRETLGRLQAPFLRCALNDPQFLDDHAHPSWLLLNRIASHAMGYEHPQDPRLLGFLDGIEPLLRELERSSEQSAQRHRETLQQVEAVITAQLRVEQEEIGPVIARRRREEEMASLQARQRERIAQRIQAVHLADAVPPMLLRFLNGPWARVLASSTLLHGEDSAPVANLTEVVEHLVRSVQPLRSTADRDWMLRSVPRVIERLRHGMALIDLPQEERDAFLSQLMAAHTDNLKAGVRRAAPPAAEPQASSTDELVRQLGSAEEGWSGVGAGNTVLDAASLDTVPADLMDEATQRPALQRVERVEDWLARLKPGAWAQVFVASRLTPLRLLWASPTRANWIFSSGAWNRDGPPRVHALTRGALEQLHAQRLAADLEGSSLLERAADELFRELQAGGTDAAKPAAFSEGLLRLNLG